MAHFKGYAGGWVDADEGLVTLHPSMAQGGGEVTCTLSQLLNVTHKPASRMVNGHVQLTIGGTGSGTLRTARCLYTWGQRGTFAPLVKLALNWPKVEGRTNPSKVLSSKWASGLTPSSRALP